MDLNKNINGERRMDLNNLDDEVKDFLKIDKNTLEKHSLTVEQRLQNFSYRYVKKLIKKTDIYKTMNEAINNGNNKLGGDLQSINDVDELGIYTMIMNVWGDKILDELEENNPDFEQMFKDLGNK